MKKIELLLLVIFVFLLLYIQMHEDEKISTVSTGITLDCARRHYSVDEIKQYIDLLSNEEHSFLQLHLSDDESVGIECEVLDLSAQREKELLTKKQMQEILDYAQEKKVEIVPEIDMPAHCGAFLELAKQKYGEAFVQEIAPLWADGIGELDISNPKAIAFAREIYEEYAELFDSGRYFHIGCDELFFAEEQDIEQYINHMADFMKQKGFVVRIWNDLLSKENIKNIDSEIQINYWSFDGDTEDADEKKERRESRASLEDLQNEGREILIYNSFYLYFVPSLSNSSEESLQYMLQDLEKNWHLTKWDGENKSLAKSEGIIGASVSVWGEDSKGVSPELIFGQTKSLYEQMVENIKEDRRGK